MTGEEFIFLNRHALQGSETKPAQPAADKDKKYVYGRRHSPAVRVQHTHCKPHQEKREDRQSHYADRAQNHRRCGHGTGTGRT